MQSYNPPTVSPTKPSSDTNSPTTSPTRPSAPSCPENLDKSYSIIAGQSTLYYAMVPSNPPGSNNGILCARLEVLDNGNDWIGIGWGPTNPVQTMIGDVVIGIPIRPTAGIVLKYDLVPFAANIMSNEKQTLQDKSIEDGKTIMKFTKLLVEDGEVTILEKGSNLFKYAHGGFNDNEIATHGPNRETFLLDFEK